MLLQKVNMEWLSKKTKMKKMRKKKKLSKRKKKLLTSVIFLLKDKQKMENLSSVLNQRISHFMAKTLLGYSSQISSEQASIYTIMDLRRPLLSNSLRISFLSE